MTSALESRSFLIRKSPSNLFGTAVFVLKNSFFKSSFADTWYFLARMPAAAKRKTEPARSISCNHHNIAPRVLRTSIPDLRSRWQRERLSQRGQFRSRQANIPRQQKVGLVLLRLPPAPTSPHAISDAPTKSAQ